MKVDQMKLALIHAYPQSPQWKKRVIKMPDDQVKAIYFRLKQAGRV